MDKNIIDLQRNSKAVCVVIKNNEKEKLTPSILMKASVSDKFLYSGERPPFAEKVDNKCRDNKICYFVILDIDKIPFESQNRYISLVKDREFNGYNLPKNCIIVFTVDDEKSLKNISPDLYHYAVVVF